MHPTRWTAVNFSGRSLLIGVLLTMVVAVACGSDDGAVAAPDAVPTSVNESERPTLSSTDDYTQRNDENGLTTILATTDT
ncbi:MAG: hypothetical protein HOE75_01580, partial [Chloroflexi bacterium]|nr:hypothetical protein [Chloroflexota bacterium]